MANRKQQIKRERQQLAALKLELQRQKDHKKAGVKRMVEQVLQATSSRHLNGLQSSKQMRNLFCAIRKLEKMDSDNLDVFLRIVKHPQFGFSSLETYEKLLLCFRQVFRVNTIEGWEMPSTDDESELFGKLFFHLFVSYNIPKCIERDIYAFAQSKNDVNTLLFFHLINGNGIHQFEGMEAISLKGRTLASVYRYIDEWDKHIELKKELQNLHDLKVSTVKSFRNQDAHKCITIEQILTVDDLIQGGEK